MKKADSWIDTCWNGTSLGFLLRGTFHFIEGQNNRTINWHFVLHFVSVFGIFDVTADLDLVPLSERVAIHHGLRNYFSFPVAHCNLCTPMGFWLRLKALLPSL